MPHDIIRQDASQYAVTPSMKDYQATRSGFTWQAATGELQGLPGGGLNIGFEATDRHVATGKADTVALRFLGTDGTRRDVSFGELTRLANRFANILRADGIAASDRVFLLLPRRLELYVAALGALKAGCVISPLFSAFGPEPIATRLKLGKARMLVTTSAFYARKVASIRDRLPRLQHVLLIDDDAVAGGVGLERFGEAMAPASDEFSAAPTSPDDAALLHFTSGTTGAPKGAMHVHGAVLAHLMSARFALDLHPSDIYWCTADPGWVTGTSYGLIAPLVAGVTSVVVEGDFDAEAWYRVLQDEGVTVWYTSPTALRLLMRCRPELRQRFSFPSLRLIASVGEPLNAQVVRWGVATLGLPIHDTWWQTETGSIMIANFVGQDIKPGSMGRPLPGVDAAIVERKAAGGVHLLAAPDTVGELALRAGWPSMFRAYLNDPERYRRCFEDGWYLSGDLARRDADGYFWFVARMGDVIKSSGHLIGPFEVESALLEHPAVAEAGAIGKPDETAGEIVKVFVALREGVAESDNLRLELIGHARKLLGPAIAPRELDFLDSLPKTRSGKILRRLLRARELGLPEGDVSGLESSQ